MATQIRLSFDVKDRSNIHNYDNIPQVMSQKIPGPIIKEESNSVSLSNSAQINCKLEDPSSESSSESKSDH
jgi:hypothetical protein